MKIYHNPRCKKSRAGLEFMKKQGLDPEIRFYLDDRLTKEELKKLLRKLKLPVEELVRTQEDYYKQELKGKQFSEDEWISILVEHPKLIKRPIIETEKMAVIGDPVENIQPFL